MRHFYKFIVAIIFMACTTGAYLNAATKPAYRNIAFNRYDSLDIYIPKDFAITKGGRGNVNTPYPVIIAISENGSKKATAITPMLQALQYGYAVVAIEYRNSLPQSAADIITVIKWVKNNGHHYRLDSRKIILWGNSNGGYLAALAACAGTYLQGFNTEMEFYTSDQMAQAQSTEQQLQKIAAELGATGTNNSTKVQAVVDLYGYFLPPQEKSQFKTLNPSQFITPQAPPFFMMYGKEDPYIPYREANEFASELKNAIGASLVEYILLPTEGHGGELFDSPQFSRQIFLFLYKVLFN